jgi:hypothetical protein
MVQVDDDLHQDSGGTHYFILVMKDDPLVPNGLINRWQCRPGEIITHDVEWSKDDDDLEVVYFATRLRPKETDVKDGLLRTSAIPADSLETIASVTVPISEYRPKQIFIASWPNILGRTMHTRVYEFKDGETGIDIYTSHDVLKQKAVRMVDKFHGLDTCELAGTAKIVRPAIEPIDED